MTRADRLAELLKRDVSEIIREEVSDPRIGFISITKVDISADLENAKIFVSIMGTEKQKRECMQGLDSATGFVRGKLGHMLEMRQVPKIYFVRDDSLEKGSRVLGIIAKLEKETSAGNAGKVRRTKKSSKKS